MDFKILRREKEHIKILFYQFLLLNIFSILKIKLLTIRFNVYRFFNAWKYQFLEYCVLSTIKINLNNKVETFYPILLSYLVSYFIEC